MDSVTDKYIKIADKLYRKMGRVVRILQELQLDIAKVYFTICREEVSEGFKKSSIPFITAKEYDLFKLPDGQVTLIIDIEDTEELTRYNTYVMQFVSGEVFEQLCNGKGQGRNTLDLSVEKGFCVHVYTNDEQVMHITKNMEVVK